MQVQSAPHITRWHAPGHVTLERDGLVVLLDPETPNWIATDERGARILAWLDGRSSLEEVQASYAREHGVELATAWLHVDRFVREAERRGFASPAPKHPAPYACCWAPSSIDGSAGAAAAGGGSQSASGTRRRL